MFEGTARVRTDYGWLPIKKIVEKKLNVSVLTYDFNLGKNVFKPIVDYHYSDNTNEPLCVISVGKKVYNWDKASFRKKRVIKLFASPQQKIITYGKQLPPFHEVGIYNMKIEDVSGAEWPFTDLPEPYRLLNKKELKQREMFTYYSFGQQGEWFIPQKPYYYPTTGVEFEVIAKPLISYNNEPVTLIMEPDQLKTGFARLNLSRKTKYEGTYGLSMADNNNYYVNTILFEGESSRFVIESENGRKNKPLFHEWFKENGNPKIKF
jgi:hypothetical protein